MSQFAIGQTTNRECSNVRVSADDIAQMASDLFTAMLKMPFDSTLREPFMPTANAVQSTIKIEGDWQAEFRVIAPLKLASEIASAMFELNGDETSKHDISDAMGEIVNVIGGNAKGIADGNCKLSLPCVANYQSQQDTPTLETTFECMSHPFTIQLVEKN